LNPTADAQAPTTPTNSQKEAGAEQHQNSVSLSWTGSTDNWSDYNVFMNSALKKTTVTGTTTTVTGLTTSNSYSLYVVAKDAAGNSSASSNVVNATTAAGTSLRIVLLKETALQMKK
jgi:hypothetical protein